MIFTQFPILLAIKQLFTSESASASQYLQYVFIVLSCNTDKSKMPLVNTYYKGKSTLIYFLLILRTILPLAL